MPDARSRTSVAAALTCLLALTATSSAAAELTLTAGRPATDASTAADLTVPTDPVDLGVVAAPVVFEVGPGVTMELADGRRYLDRLEVRSPGADQVLVNDLTLDDYVAGVAEMPGRWPLEALKAQAVAARTYAWHAQRLGTFATRGYDICDTVDCQAFAGASQQEEGAGSRWREAVEATSGEVLVDDEGAPILARYFSTSGGRTLPNEVVFPSSGPRPYLVGIDDPHDEVSPYHRWQVRFSRAEFDAILGRGERLSAVVPVAEVERLGDVDRPGVDVRLTGEDGTEVVLDSVELRRFISEVAPSLYPDRFPGRRADGLRRLPSTVPSSRFSVEVGDDEVVLDGRGWGHAVGMGQYGARGRAADGASYDEILAAYYGGLEPTVADGRPERIRVGLSRADVGSVTPDGPMRIVAAGETVAEDAAGTWTVASADGGLRLSAPPGWGRPAEASRTEPADEVPAVPPAIAVAATTATPGTLALRVEDDAGDPVRVEDRGTVGPGRQVAVWDGTTDGGEPVGAGTYQVMLTLTAADGSVAGTALPVTVEVDRSRRAGPAGGDDRPRAPATVVALAVVLLGGMLLVRRRAATTRSTTTRDPR